MLRRCAISKGLSQEEKKNDEAWLSPINYIVLKKKNVDHGLELLLISATQLKKSKQLSS